MASAPNPVKSSRRNEFATSLNQFWQRVTDGLELNQLWNQFQQDARASYRLYSREVDSTQGAAQSKGKQWWQLTKQFFWAILEKLSPARRVLLLIALVLILINPQFVWQEQGDTHIVNLDFRLWGGLLMFVLLVLEVTDRVVMKRDLQIAREIQMWLLPANPPQVPGLELAFATRPANTVAGDYYDAFPRPSSTASDGRYVLAVADVAGKSIPAALLMATFQASLKTLAAIPCTLSELVDSMNHYACSNSQGGLRFTTAFIAEYIPQTRTLAYINAGHNPPILRRTSGAIERLSAGGLPLGIQSDLRYQPDAVTLAGGDWLVIFTDGLVEAVNGPGQEYGEERLVSVLQLSANLSPPKLLSRIMVDVDLFVGRAAQHDDVTCMLIKAA